MATTARVGAYTGSRTNKALGSSAQTLIERFIEADPHQPGIAEARLRNFGVHVWALIGHAKATGGDPTDVARDYDVPVEAVEAALAYYARYAAIIDDRLAANAA